MTASCLKGSRQDKLSIAFWILAPWLLEFVLQSFEILIPSQVSILNAVCHSLDGKTDYIYSLDIWHAILPNPWGPPHNNPVIWFIYCSVGSSVKPLVYTNYVIIILQSLCYRHVKLQLTPFLSHVTIRGYHVGVKRPSLLEARLINW